MELTDLHIEILRATFERTLGRPEKGAVAYVRCLVPEILQCLVESTSFTSIGWEVWRVADFYDKSQRTIPADRAVEMREAKDKPVLLLVDTSRAGAGIDGIYSAAREVTERSLFPNAIRLASKRLSRSHREFAKRAISRAGRAGQRLNLSPWAKLDFYIQCALAECHPGERLYLIGLWPILSENAEESSDKLDVSQLFVDRLLGPTASTVTFAARIESLRLRTPSPEQMRDLEQFLHKSASSPLVDALSELSERSSLWINSLNLEGPARSLTRIAGCWGRSP